MMVKKWIACLITIMMLNPGTAFPEASGKGLDVNDVSYGKEKRVSMDFENAALKDVLKAFSKQAGVNFVASQTIEEKNITVYLNNVTVDEALDSILNANDLGYEKKDGNIYMIKPEGRAQIRTITRVFKFENLQVYDMDMKPEGVGFADVTSYTNLTNSGSSSGSSSSGSSGSGSSSGTSGTTSTLSSPSSSAAAASSTDEKPKNIIEILKTLLSEHGKIVADRRTNSLIITDIPSSFEAIEKTIKDLDVEPLQIMISAEIIETTTDAVKRIGMEYGSSTETLSVTYGTTNDDTGQSMQVPLAFPLSEQWVKNVFNTSLSASGLFQYGTLTPNATTVVLKLFANDDDTKFLSRPKVMTINNEPAVIKVAANTAIGLDSVNVTQTQQVIQKAERVETGIILKVVPSASSSGNVFLYVEPSISRVATSSILIATTSDATQPVLDPQVRSSSTNVVVKDGHTIVIAGLIQTDNYKTTRKVPFLGDLPFIGEPFKSHYTRGQDTEIIIFVTPHIVKKKDAEYVLPKEMTERDRMLERALDKYSVKNARETAKRKAKKAGQDEAAEKAKEKALSEAVKKASQKKDAEATGAADFKKTEPKKANTQKRSFLGVHY